MGFYEQIGKYYDYIFPVGQAQLKFISETVGAPPGKVLDVACGTGGYSVELARLGYNVTAVDLEDKMVLAAREKAEKESVPVDVLACDMKELAGSIKSRFKCIFCIGNSIVHLGNLEDILGVLTQMHSLLEDEGFLVIQIINYDRILKHQVSELPPIKDESVKLEFIRKYEFDEHKGMINFNTTLKVDGAGKTEEYNNSIELFPVKSEDMMEMLSGAGYRDIKFYGDFNYSEYNENSYMLVVKASR